MDCPSEFDLDLDQWSDRINAQLKSARYPLSGIIELTDRCNLRCVHCYINQPVGSLPAKQSELNTAQVCQIIDAISSAGCLFLILTGGEVLVRPDFPEIYLHTLRAGILPTIFTNGTMITTEIADLLASAPPQGVDITLYGATRETYEAVTQQPGSFDRCMNGIKMLLERGVHVSLKAMLLTINKHELNAMKAFADELGLKFRYDGTLWPRLDGDEQPYRYRISTEEMFEIDRADEERFAEWQRRAKEFSEIPIRKDYVFNCGAATRSFHIDSKGNLCACTMVRKPSYNLLEIPFDIAWEKLGELRKLKRQKNTACETCLVGSLCAQCPGWFLLVHGDLETPVDFICNTGKFRYNHMCQIEEVNYGAENLSGT